MKDLDFFEVFLRFLRSTNDCLSEHISETSSALAKSTLRLAKSSIRLRHSCHCLCESDFHGIRLCLSYGTSSVCDSALCLPIITSLFKGGSDFVKSFL